MSDDTEECFAQPMPNLGVEMEQFTMALDKANKDVSEMNLFEYTYSVNNNVSQDSQHYRSVCIVRWRSCY